MGLKGRPDNKDEQKLESAYLGFLVTESSSPLSSPELVP